MRILTRASVFIAGWVVVLLLVQAGGERLPDVGVGAGLLVLLLVALVAGVWGWYDGRRVDYGDLAVIWGLVGVLMGLIVPVFTALVARELDRRVVASDVLTGMPFVAALVAGPALVAGAVAALRGGPPRPGDRAPDGPGSARA